MRLKYIEFTFENCDSIKIAGKYVGYFLVDNLKTYFKRLASNWIDRVDVAEILVIEIHKDANKERYKFDQDQIKDFKQMTFDRFTSYNDITGIKFELEDDGDVENGVLPSCNCYDYSINWTGDSEYANDSQKSYISKDGNLYIVIDENGKIEDYFDLETINDSECMDFHFDMCSVGDKYGNSDRYNDDVETEN